MTRIYIISPGVDRAQTCGLMAGSHYFRARTERNGPYKAVKTQVNEHRDEDGNLVGDVQHIVEIDGTVIPFEKWEHMALFGDEITEAEYKTMLADGPWTEQHYGARPGQKVDIRKLPFVTP